MGRATTFTYCLAIIPKYSARKFINNLKTVTSRLIRKEFGEQVNSYYRNTAFWGESYFIASCGGVTVEKLKAYVQAECLRRVLPRKTSFLRTRPKINWSLLIHLLYPLYLWHNIIEDGIVMTRYPSRPQATRLESDGCEDKVS